MVNAVLLAQAAPAEEDPFILMKEWLANPYNREADQEVNDYWEKKTAEEVKAQQKREARPVSNRTTVDLDRNYFIGKSLNKEAAFYAELAVAFPGSALSNLDLVERSEKIIEAYYKGQENGGMHGGTKAVRDLIAPVKAPGGSAITASNFKRARLPDQAASNALTYYMLLRDPKGSNMSIADAYKKALNDSLTAYAQGGVTKIGQIIISARNENDRIAQVREANIRFNPSANVPTLPGEQRAVAAVLPPSPVVPPARSSGSSNSIQSALTYIASESWRALGKESAIANAWIADAGKNGGTAGLARHAEKAVCEAFKKLANEGVTTATFEQLGMGSEAAQIAFERYTYYREQGWNPEQAGSVIWDKYVAGIRNGGMSGGYNALANQ
jgi:hypothetical protein